MMDIRGQAPYQLPHRKPIPPHASVNHSDLQPLTKLVPDVDLRKPQQQRSVSQYSDFPPRQASRQFSGLPPSSQHQPPLQHQYQQSPAFAGRRTPSQSTSTTHNNGFPPSRTPSNVSSHISRTSSTRSGVSVAPGSYVALMRKQKATVWCDRAQHEDPRIAAQQKAAKIRAAREVNTGITAEGRNSTSGSMGNGSLGVRSKIRHHGLPKATGYSANLVGGGVPMRLSANEVGDEGTYNRPADTGVHHRTESARSSGSQKQYLSPEQKQSHRYSQGNTSTTGQMSPPVQDQRRSEDTPISGQVPAGGDYFSKTGGNGGSGGSSERESSFGKVGSMEAPVAKHEGKSAEELKRRGSVDERSNTMTLMGGGRLFVANPDMDSD